MKTSERFTSYTDLKGFVSERLPDDLSCYGIPNIKDYNKGEFNELDREVLIEALTEKATENLINLLKNEDSINFSYGECLCDDWFDKLFPSDGDWYNIFE